MMSRIGKWLAGAVLMSGVAGCSTASMQAYKPTSVKTKYSPEVLGHAARWTLEENGYVTSMSESEPFTYTTREKEVFTSGVPRLAYRYAFTVSSKDGTLTIEASCKQNSAMEREEYEDCGPERPERVVNEQAKLQEAILERAKRESKK